MFEDHLTNCKEYIIQCFGCGTTMPFKAYETHDCAVTRVKIMVGKSGAPRLLAKNRKVDTKNLPEIKDV